MAAKLAEEKSGRPAYLASECPLAGEHILQGIERLNHFRIRGEPGVSRVGVVHEFLQRLQRSAIVFQGLSQLCGCPLALLI